MQYGARNKVRATVKSIKQGEVMALAWFDITNPCEMASVLTVESAEEMGLKVGDEVTLLVKAVNVMPVKE